MLLFPSIVFVYCGTPIYSSLIFLETRTLQLSVFIKLKNINYIVFIILSWSVSCSFGGKSVPDLLVGLMARDKPSEMQMGAARCITYMHRAGAVSAEDPKILYRTLPCLVRGSG